MSIISLMISLVKKIHHFPVIFLICYLTEAVVVVVVPVLGAAFFFFRGGRFEEFPENWQCASTCEQGANEITTLETSRKESRWRTSKMQCAEDTICH